MNTLGQKVFKSIFVDSGSHPKSFFTPVTVSRTREKKVDKATAGKYVN